MAEHDEAVHRTPKKVRSVRLSTMILVAVIVGATSFIGGMRADQFAIQFGNSQNKEAPEKLNFSSAQTVYDKLREDFDGKLDAQKLIDGAKKGMVEAAGDPYTMYFTDQEAKQFLGDLEGKFSGIGAELDKRNNQLVISSTIDNSPARQAGLQPGDAIVKVNNEDTTGWSIEQGVSKIRGDKGTTVKLAISRDNQLQEVSIVRDDIVTPSVVHSIDSNNIGYMRITRFAEGDTSSLARQAAQEFKEKGVKGVVLDLRGNGGGYLTAAQDVAGLWLNSKVVVQERRGDTVQDTLKSGTDPILNGIPTTVLVDGGSASAAKS